LSQSAIQIEGLSKCYRIGARATLGQWLTRKLAATCRAIKPASDAVASPSLQLADARSSTIADASTTESDQSIKASSLRCKGNHFYALRDINLNVERGEVVGIVGANGAGKSTLLKVLSQITDPTEGRVQYHGRIASLLEVGTGFHPELTGRENIYLNGAILGMRSREIKAKFDEIVDFSGTERFLDTPVKRYSSGMRVRLAFAVAAHLQPEILVIDEVLAVGDAAFQQKCIGKMNDVAKREGRTVLFVSHNMASVQQLCSRAIFLQDGQLVKQGRPADVVDAYLNALGTQQITKENDLTRLPRTGEHSQRIRIAACRLLDADNQPATDLKFGEPFSIEVEAEAREAMNNLSFVAGISTSLHQRIVTTMSEEAGLSCSVIPGQRVRARLRIDALPLVPGDYRLTLSLRANKEALDLLPNFREFKVLPVLTDASQVPNGLWGVIHVTPKWTIDPPVDSKLAA